MAKLIIADLNGKAPLSSRPKVSEKRRRTADGKVAVVRTLNAESPTFGSDFRYVFARNVAKARRDNKKVTGALDVIVAKS